MRSGKCRNCGEESVYRRPASMGGFLEMSNAHRIPLDKDSYAVATNYVCTHCGFIDCYLEDAAALAKVAAKWEQIPR